MMEVETVAKTSKNIVPALEAESKNLNQQDGGAMQEDDDASDKETLTDAASTKLPSILGGLNDTKEGDLLDDEE